MDLRLDYVHERTYTKPNYGGKDDRHFSEGRARLRLGEETLIEQRVIVDRSTCRTEEAYQHEALEQGAKQIASWFDRVDRMIEKLESL